MKRRGSFAIASPVGLRSSHNVDSSAGHSGEEISGLLRSPAGKNPLATQCVRLVLSCSHIGILAL